MREYFVCGRIVLLTIALAGWTDPVLARSDDVRVGSPPTPPGATANTPPRAYLAGPPRVEVPLPQPDFTVEKTLIFNQPVQWRKIHFLSFGNFDLCPGRRQEVTSDLDQHGCGAPTSVG